MIVGKYLASGMIVVALLAATPVSAADRTEAIRFKTGASFATTTGSLKGYDTAKYVIGASAGQTMSVRFKPSNASCYFNVSAAGAEEALFVGSTTGNEFSGSLKASGDYVVQVYLMRNAARRSEACRYSFTMEIK